MAKLLLLYDTKETDLGRDFKSLLSELDLEVVMIPLSPDKGKTLQEKETHYFSGTNGAVFLITPGSERDGKFYPSPSVSHEMGQAMAAYSTLPERVSYLVDKRCTIPAVDQRSYIHFDRENIRSILDAITQLIRNLKDSGLYGKKNIEPQTTPSINVPEFSKDIPDNIKAVCEALSKQPDGMLDYEEFNLLLETTFKMTTQTINFVKGDLKKKGLITQSFYGPWRLLPLGFDVVRHEIALRLKNKREGLEKRAIGGGVEDVFKTREVQGRQITVDPTDLPRLKK